MHPQHITNAKLLQSILLLSSASDPHLMCFLAFSF